MLNIKTVIAFMVSIASLAIAGNEQKKTNLGGYIMCPKDTAPESFNGGFSLYSTIWPIMEAHPGRRFQTGLCGTWMKPQNEGKPSMKIGSEKTGGIGYTSIEGGLGVWRSTRFATITPKFHMGGVALSFKGIADGPGVGKGDWEELRGRYGVAQLSPWVIFPPDGLNFKQGSVGQVCGYGYLPLPLTPAKTKTAGQDVPTGNNAWTLFLNTKTFKGPVAFFTPYFWSRHTLDYPNLHGKYFDSRPCNANRAIQMETQFVPSIQAEDNQGNLFSRVTPVRFPIDSKGVSHLLSDNTVYDKSALWDAVDAWFKGGPIASGKINPASAHRTKVKNSNSCNWKFYSSKTEKYPVAWSDIAQRAMVNDYTISFKWNRELVKKNAARNLVELPEFYQLVKSGEKPTWLPVAANKVPVETGLRALKTADFYTGDDNHDAYTTPESPDSPWKTPGPKAGPFKVKLGDGSTLTYSWYRFCEQPAILHADLTDQEREDLQAKVELLHTHWKKDQEYLAAPPIGELVELDPALVVTPPKGLEVGYVPIATHQSY